MSLSLGAKEYYMSPYIDTNCEFAFSFCEPYFVNYVDDAAAISAHKLVCLHIQSQFISIEYGDRCFCINAIGQKSSISGKLWKVELLDNHTEVISSCWKAQGRGFWWTEDNQETLMKDTLSDKFKHFEGIKWER